MLSCPFARPELNHLWQFPTKFEMAVNLKTAKALGFAVPPSIMLRTDEVIRDSTGHSGRASDVDDVRAHGKDERVGVKAFFEGGEYLYRLVKRLAGGK